MLWYITICGRAIDVNFLYKTRIWVIFTVTLIDVFMQVSIVYGIWSWHFFVILLVERFVLMFKCIRYLLNDTYSPTISSGTQISSEKITILKLGKFSMVVFVVVKLVAFTMTWNGLHRMFCLQLFFLFPFLFF